jgi:hypothetical protein
MMNYWVKSRAMEKLPRRENQGFLMSPRLKHRRRATTTTTRLVFCNRGDARYAIWPIYKVCRSTHGIVRCSLYDHPLLNKSVVDAFGRGPIHIPSVERPLCWLFHISLLGFTAQTASTTYLNESYQTDTEQHWPVGLFRITSQQGLSD